MARVFIGVPTVNRPELVQLTVRSLLRQTLTDFRVVVSDNASDPPVADTISRFVEDLRDARISFHRQPHNGGEYGQGRYFFGEAREEFFIILHDDDILKPEYLERAVATLESRPDAAFFIANPFIFDEEGLRLPEKTREYLEQHGRIASAVGEFDVLSKLLSSGFAPISGTCFRLSALRQSGFVDEDCVGNYPFELNVFIRLGERHARGWFCVEELLGFRSHRNNMRQYLKLMDNPQVVGTMMTILERRRFTGRSERLRRAILGRLHRATAVQSARKGDAAACRAHTLRALAKNPRALRTWAMLPVALLSPRALRAVMPAPGELSFAPPVDSAAVTREAACATGTRGGT